MLKIGKKILIVENSAIIRRYLANMLESEGYSVEFAKDINEALQKILKEHFSMVLLDIDTYALKSITEILKNKVLRVIAMSKDSSNTLDALELGAISYILKPKNSIDITKVSDDILKKIKQALLIMPNRIKQELDSFKVHNTSIDTNIDMGFVLIGASTGGPRLIEQICKTLPQDYPHAVCIVQHMPSEFTSNFAKRLNTLSKLEVLEAQNALELKKSRIIIAKGGKHLHIRKKLNTYTVLLSANVRERFFVPSVDEMFLSALEVLPVKKILAVELTGIGDDGADGMVQLKKAGAYTIAESEKTAVVYGMPKEAALRGGATKVLDFNDILDEIIKYGQ